MVWASRGAGAYAEGGAQGMRFRAAVYGEIVAICFDPGNIAHGNEKRASILARDYALAARAAPELRTLLVGGGPIRLAYRQCTVRNWSASRRSGLLQFPIQMRSMCRGFLVERSRAKLSCKQI